MYLRGQFWGELVADYSVVIKLGEGLVKSPGFASLVNLGLPAAGDIRKYASTVNHSYFAV